METIKRSLKVKDRINQIQSIVDYLDWRISEIRAVQKSLPFSSVLFHDLQKIENDLQAEIDKQKMIVRHIEECYPDRNCILITYK